MYTDKNLDFLREKILHINSAIIHLKDNYSLPDSAHLVHTIEVDEDGCIWFLAFQQWKINFTSGKEFAAEMKYYRKGTDFYVNVSGTAQVIKDPLVFKNKLSLYLYPGMLQHKVSLFRLKIITADCVEKNQEENMLDKFTSEIKKWWAHAHLPFRRQENQQVMA